MTPQPEPKASLLDWALAYARLGFWCFPVHSIRAGRCSCGKRDCSNKGKHPRTAHGFQDASTDEATIRAWWATWPDANIGIATGASGLVIIDIDPRHGGDESWKDLKPDAVSLDTAISITGGGGNHVAYKEGDTPIPTFVASTSHAPLGPGIDVRAVGGYFVAPPSSHESGNDYEWEQNPWDKPPTYLPSWLEERLALQPRKQGDGKRTSFAELLQGVPKGQRDWEIYRHASAARRVDLPYDWTLAAVLEAAAHCTPPFDPDLARRKVDSAYRHAPSKDAVVDPEKPGDLFVWAQDLDRVPAAEWIIEDIMLAESLSELVGAYGTKKTFIALDMACSLATGRHWHGHDVQEGYVVYIYAEGLRGLRARLRAWEEYHGQTVERLAFVPRALRLLADEDVTQFIAEIVEKVPGKVVAVFVDTVARAMVGGDENKTQDMSTFVYNCDLIKQQTGATVVLVHHNNRAGIDRGNTALPAAVDTQMTAEKKNERIVLKCAKMKDAPEFEPIEFEVVPTLASIVLKDTAPVVVHKPLRPSAQSLLDLLKKNPNGVTPKEAETTLGIAERTARTAMNQLVEAGFATREQDGRGAVWANTGTPAHTGTTPARGRGHSGMPGDPPSERRGSPSAGDDWAAFQGDSDDTGTAGDEEIEVSIDDYPGF